MKASLRGSPDRLYLYVYRSFESWLSILIGFAGIPLFDNPVAITPLNSSSLISGKLILITFPLKISFAETIFSINSIDFFVINSISFASYDATEIAIGGYF